MTPLTLPLYSWDSGAFIMIGIFALVIFALVGFIVAMMNGGKNKED